MRNNKYAAQFFTAQESRERRKETKKELLNKNNKTPYSEHNVPFKELEYILFRENYIGSKQFRIKEVLARVFRLDKPENFATFKKNIKDGYRHYFINIWRSINLGENKVFKFEYPTYERNQTLGIKDFKSKFTPKAWRSLTQLSDNDSIKLVNFLVESNYLLYVIFCLDNDFTVDEIINTYDIVKSLISRRSSKLVSDERDIHQNMALFLRNADKVVDAQLGPNTLRHDIIDHYYLYYRLLALKDGYPEIITNLGPLISGKWSYRRFTDEHSRLSALMTTIEQEKLIITEKAKRWSKKTFFNIERFKILKKFSVECQYIVGKVTLDISLINDPYTLLAESKELKHCVFSYLENIRKANYIAFSVRGNVSKHDNCTVGYEIVKTKTEIPGKFKHSLVLDQVRGFANKSSLNFDLKDLHNKIQEVLDSSGFTVYFFELLRRPLGVIAHKENELKKVTKYGRGNRQPILAWEERFTDNEEQKEYCG